MIWDENGNQIGKSERDERGPDAWLRINTALGPILLHIVVADYGLLYETTQIYITEPGPSNIHSVNWSQL